jgi:DNA-binding MarR family transcriptional regulator
MPQSGGKIDMNILLRKAGIDADMVETVIGIDALMQTWRRRTMRRELGHKALIDLKIGIDLAQFDVLVAIEAPPAQFGDSEGETMVATVAERLGIDPSRASRVVSEMVEAGYARRAASQADARRTIIELTDAGQAIIEAVRAYKFLILGDFLSEWQPEEVTTFLPMLRKFAQWSDHLEKGVQKFEDEIALLAQQIAADRKQSEPA